MTDKEKDEYIFGLDQGDIPPSKPLDEAYFWAELGFTIGILFCIVIGLSYLFATNGFVHVP